MPIYTRTGDAGDTGLFGGGRVGKEDPRVEAYGELDELNAVMGLARVSELDPGLDALAREIQEQLFVVGSVLATPSGSKAEQHIPKLKPEWVQQAEQHIDALDRELPAMTHFILPGGSRAAAVLHLARTVCRRAERRVVPLMRAGKIDASVVVYLNRLSDLLFTMARAANRRAGIEDVKWIPQKP